MEEKRTVLHVKASAAARLKAGGAWVCSNEIVEPLREMESGAPVELEGPHGQELGVACLEPKSLIAARRFGPPGIKLDLSFFRTRLAKALEMRSRLVGGRVFRLAFSEADLLPGLIVDRYGEVLAVQFLTWGMESHKGLVISARRDSAGKFVVAQLYQAYQAQAVQLPFQRAKETTYKIKFEGLADPTRSVGDQVGKIYRPI